MTTPPEQLAFDTVVDIAIAIVICVAGWKVLAPPRATETTCDVRSQPPKNWAWEPGKGILVFDAEKFEVQLVKKDKTQ